jgi:hypothetical protein
MKIQNTLLIAGLVASSLSAFGQDKRNYVSPTDPELRIDKKYDDPRRASYNVAGNVGVDISTFSGGIYGEVAGSYSPKRFTFKGSYAFDVSNSDFISKSTLLEKGNKYRNIQVGAYFNYKDETTSYNASPTIGIDVIGKSTSGNVVTTTFYAYKTDFEVQKRITRGFGVTINNFASNVYYNAEKVDSAYDFIRLENSAAIPSGFILPFSSTIIGLSYSMGDFTSYKTFFNYKTYPRIKLKRTSFKLVNFDLLFAPTISNSESIYFMNAGATDFSELKIEDIKKRRFGFKIGVSTNEFKKLIAKPGLYMNGEIGLRPGIFPRKAGDPESSKFVNSIFSQPFYMKWGIGITF